MLLRWLRAAILAGVAAAACGGGADLEPEPDDPRRPDPQGAELQLSAPHFVPPERRVIRVGRADPTREGSRAPDHPALEVGIPASVLVRDGWAMATCEHDGLVFDDAVPAEVDDYHGYPTVLHLHTWVPAARCEVHIFDHEDVDVGTFCVADAVAEGPCTPPIPATGNLPRSTAPLPVLAVSIARRWPQLGYEHWLSLVALIDPSLEDGRQLVARMTTYGAGPEIVSEEIIVPEPRPPLAGRRAARILDVEFQIDGDDVEVELYRGNQPVSSPVCYSAAARRTVPCPVRPPRRANRTANRIAPYGRNGAALITIGAPVPADTWLSARAACPETEDRELEPPGVALHRLQPGQSTVYDLKDVEPSRGCSLRLGLVHGQELGRFCRQGGAWQHCPR